MDWQEKHFEEYELDITDGALDALEEYLESVTEVDTWAETFHFIQAL